jgi:hypothetical protein
LKARQLKLILCEDWFIYMYDPNTYKCYQYNTELMPEWFDYSDDIMSENNAVEKYMFPIVYGQNRSLAYCDSVYNPDMHSMFYIGND